MGNVRKAGSLNLDKLRAVAQWKAPRSAGRVESNDEGYVTAITGFALQTKCERARIEVLTRLDGVGWPTASVILHFFHCDRYPILDFRALWSVGEEVRRSTNSISGGDTFLSVVVSQIATAQHADVGQGLVGVLGCESRRVGDA